VGIFPAVGPFADDAAQRDAAISHAVDEGVDHFCVGDHVSFHVGAGSDGLIYVTWLLTAQGRGRP
jgi:hypothetical protein